MGFDIAAIHRSASGPGRVLGDFYDVFCSSRGRWHTVLGDVCGSGVEAASVAALARWSHHALAEVHDTPGAIFASMNEVVLRETGGRFLTARALGVETDPSANGCDIDFASAGHHPAVVRRIDGTVEKVEANGWMLGCFDRLKVGATELHLSPGDQIVMFTDGITEAHHHDSERGHARVMTHLAALGPASAAEVAASVIALADAEPGDRRDDAAVLVLGPLRDS